MDTELIKKLALEAVAKGRPFVAVIRQYQLDPATLKRWIDQDKAQRTAQMAERASKVGTKKKSKG